MSTVKTAGTTECVAQSELSYVELPNYAENQRVLAEMSMLDEVAAEAARLAEAPTTGRYKYCLGDSYGG